MGNSSCTFPPVNLTVNPKGTINLPVNRDCVPAGQTDYSFIGFTKNSIDYDFQVMVNTAKLTYLLPTTPVLTTITVEFTLVPSGLRPVKSITTDNSKKTAVGFQGLNFYFKVQFVNSPGTAWQFNGTLAGGINQYILNMSTQGASFDSNLGVFLPIPGGENANLPVILGAALGTQDGKQICFLTYKVVTKEGENDYRFYCNKLNLVSVMKGKGCTLIDRVDYLQKQNAVIDAQSFVQYAMLRTILSQQLQKEPFGCFNIQFLRRRYYAPFLRELAKSEFARYLDFFIESVQIRHYWQFFKK